MKQAILDLAADQPIELEVVEWLSVPVAGAKGEKGDKSDKGSVGDVGPAAPGFESVKICGTSSSTSTVTVINSFAVTVTASCPTGYFALGGGGTCTDPVSTLRESYPSSPTQWQVKCDGPNPDTGASTYAVCSPSALVDLANPPTCPGGPV